MQFTRKVAALGCGLLLGLSGCGFGGAGPHLTSPNAAKTVEGLPRVHKGDTVTIGSMFGCLNRSGSITVTNIEPVHDTGLKVTSWGMRPNPFWKPPADIPPVGGQIGIARYTLAQLKFPTSRRVTAKCGKDGEGYEFAVQVEKTTEGEAGAGGWIVTYKTGDETRKFGFPIAIKLCNEKVAWAKKCRALKV